MQTSWSSLKVWISPLPPLTPTPPPTLGSSLTERGMNAVMAANQSHSLALGFVHITAEANVEAPSSSVCPSE